MNQNMKKKNSGLKLCLWMIFIGSVLVFSTWQGWAAPSSDSAIVIKSKTCEFDLKNKVVTYIGDVDARRDDIIIRCQRLLAYIGEQPKVKSSENNTFKFDKIVAKNNVVVIRQTDGMTMNCEEAVYFQNEQKIEATGNPVVIKQDRNLTEGSKFTFFLKTNRVVGEGPTKSTIFTPSN
jgi:lipopolysaccharide transport protein LptA